MTNVAAVRSVNNMLEAKMSSVGSPDAMFQAILEEKLGVVSTNESESRSDSYGSVNGADYSSLLTDGSVPGWDELVNESYANYLASSYASESTASGETKYDGYIKEASKTYGVPESLIKAVIACESSFNEDAVSKSGAIGLMQLMPATAKGLGVEDPYDPQQNIMGGTKYLSSLVKNFDGDLILALSGYNMGGNGVKKLGITPNSSNESDYDSIPSGVLSYAKKVISKLSEYGGV